MPAQLEVEFPHTSDLEALWAWTRGQPWHDAELARAVADFTGAAGPALDRPTAQQQDLRLLDWFHLDRPVPALGAPPVTLWLAATARPDSPLARSRVGAFRVARTVPHSLVVLTALGTGATHRLKSKPLSVGLRRGQLAFGRLFPHGDNWAVHAPLLAVDEATATALRPLDDLAAIADGLTLERLLFKP